jgi:hypothetical protein
MTKKFSELKAGDDFYIWSYNTLHKDKVKSALTKQSAREITKDKRPFIASDEIRIVLEAGGPYYISYGENESAIIWGTDGWNEYKIFGTSKDAVRALLEEVLLEDAQKLAANTQKWLTEFEK